MTGHHAASLEPGTVIGGKYEVVRCLGAGSMGMVYACRHRDLQGQLVAAKVLFNEVASDKVAAARFKNEILAAYGVSHPNVVRAYEFIRDGDLVAYTMEFIGGGDLAERMSSPELLRIGEILRLLSQMTAGVQAIHDAGIVHRDLKPENIMLTSDGTVKIADFGIARKTDGPKLTEYGGVVGTLEYVSPEYMLRSQVDWRSDIYALGVLAYELITGEPPFKGDSAYASISKRLQTDPEPPSRFRAECPNALDNIVLKALRREPDDRYQSAVEIFYDIQRVASTLGISEVSSAGILIPPASSIAGKRYVGPSLSNPANSQGETNETNIITSESSIGFDAGGSIGSGAGQGAVGSDKRSTMDDFRSRQPTDYLDPRSLEARKFNGQGVVKPGSANDFVAQSQKRDAAQGSNAGNPKLNIENEDLASSLLKAKGSSIRVLDGVILVCAALSGIGAGYLFLRVFSPRFLEKIMGVGLGS